MNKYYRTIIKSRLKKYSKEARGCLYDGNYEWQDTKRTLMLVNSILKNIPASAWPKLKEDDDHYFQNVIRHGQWKIRLFWGDKKAREADLIYDRDDHTAWVKESRREKGKFIDCDIGGS